MKRRLVGTTLLCTVFGVALVGFALANGAVDGDEPAMMVSPSTIVLAKVDTVTVHTNILASAVEPGSVSLNGAAPTGVWADNLGHLVARFLVVDLDLEPGEVTLTLSGEFWDGYGFAATDAVEVK